MSNIVGSLRWGLPVGSSTVEIMPGLFRLEESLAAARRWISAEMLRLPAETAPVALPEPEFASQLARLRADAASVPVDAMVAEFDAMCRAVARLTSPDRDDAATAASDPAEAYRRYVQWLPFAAVSARFNAAVSRDLDYQPRDADATSLPFGSHGVARALPPG